jgi:GNAT superfamily N-acetyltransferase
MSEGPPTPARALAAGFADARLARRLEAAEAVLAAETVRTLARLDPASGAAVLEAGDAVAAWAGADSPLSHVIGLGLAGPVTAGELDAIEAFHRDRGATAVQVELSPFADPSLSVLLTARDYRITGFEHVLVRPLAPEDAGLEGFVPPGITVAPARVEDEAAWCRIGTEGFFGPVGPPPGFEHVGRTLFALPASTPWLARIDGQPVGAAGFSERAGVGSLWGMATLPAFRARGVHGALLAARLSEAARAGCDVATAGARPGSVSHRNMERAGFHVAYTRPVLVRRWT